MNVIHSWWHSFLDSFGMSETILWARIQVAFGVITTVLITLDLTPFTSDPKIIAGWAMTNGLLTEYLRRRGTEMRDGVLHSDDTVDKATIMELANSNDAPILKDELIKLVDTSGDKERK